MPFAHVVTAGGNTCDFCTCVPVHKLYRCKNFELRGVPVFQKNEGVWAACWKCSELVDAAKWTELSEHAFQVFMKKHRVPRHEAFAARAQFTEMVRMFAVNKLNEN
jgi:hypothetical protein